MGFKQEAADKLVELDERVIALETLALRLARGGTAQVNRTATPAPTGARSALDYGAVAFGLVTMKADVNGIRNSGTDTSTAEVNRYYGRAVQYFADVFAKADPGFNEAEFKRQAGV